MKFRLSTVLSVAVCLLGILPALAQQQWQPKALMAQGQPMSTLHAIAIPASAEYQGRTIQAWVVLVGHARAGGPGYPEMGVILSGLDTLLPASERELFEGPDLDEKVIHGDAFQITFGKEKEMRKFSTRAALSGVSSMFPPDSGGRENQYFVTNLRPLAAEKNAWKSFLAAMSHGFEEGSIRIGGSILSHAVTVKFSGAGIAPALQDLMAFTGQ